MSKKTPKVDITRDIADMIDSFAEQAKFVNTRSAAARYLILEGLATEAAKGRWDDSAVTGVKP
jgi:hypothetical protein